ncbi:MAG: phospholipase D-like domain-containing protein [Prevotella sp.]|nr:phospholipase D-like domain-containing protein [Alistipes senegalensis]MCM1357020.1 phospholipase D-like domain-containing protein [Prevotella sp.]MCM1472609.1 phospholipase D-like domain-containing protein [Muribaculaceae bacterium]
MPFYFTNIAAEIKNALSRAKYSVLICVAWIDFNQYYWTLDALLKRGVRVQVIVTASEKNKNNNCLNDLISHGMAFKEILMLRAINHMHNKIAIIDNETVITGSFNWTNNARFNYENVLIEKRSAYEIKLLQYEINHIERLNEITNYIHNHKILCPHEGCRAKAKIIMIYDDDNYVLMASRCSSGHLKKYHEAYFERDGLLDELEYIHDKYDNVYWQDDIMQANIYKFIEENQAIESFVLHSSLPIACIMHTDISTNHFFDEGERILSVIWQDKNISFDLEYSNYEDIRYD